MAEPLRRRILGLTGTRAEFGLLCPVFRAIADRPQLELLVAVTGTHHLPPTHTRDEVAAEFPIAVEFAMQSPGASGRLGDALAFARGVEAMARTLDALRPDAVLVLGDRVEAFAGASAAAIAGVRVAHIHGGDRAEGVADESMRHAISKLAHLHFAASAESGERLRKMGEDPAAIHVVGSPAIDGLDAMPALADSDFDALGRPEIAVLLHPTGRDQAAERAGAEALLTACAEAGRVLALHPNSDAGREGIVEAIASTEVRRVAHLPRKQWIGLLRRVRLLAGNSSAGLIEAAALRLRVLDVGSRQAGRERGGNVLHTEDWSLEGLRHAVGRALGGPTPPASHPFGTGRAAAGIAEVLANRAFDSLRLAKRNSY